MNTDNLIMLVSIGDSDKTYAITHDKSYNTTYADVINHDKDNARQPFGDEFKHPNDALYAVLGAEMDANNEQEQSFTVKMFKQLDDDRIDISRAWVIKFDLQSEEYRVSTEIDGFKGKSPCDIKGIDSSITLSSLNTSVDFAAFLEKVYSENNRHVGEKTTTLGAIYDKAQDIMAKPFDAADLKLLPKKEKADVER